MKLNFEYKILRLCFEFTKNLFLILVQIMICKTQNECLKFTDKTYKIKPFNYCQTVV